MPGDTTILALGVQHRISQRKVLVNSVNKQISNRASSNEGVSEQGLNGVRKHAIERSGRIVLK